jgi:hypothetical protein
MPQVSHSRLRFSLRALLVMTTLAAVSLGYQLHWIRQRRAMIASGVIMPIIGSPKPQPRAPGLLFLFGEPGYVALTLCMPGDADRQRGGYVTPLRPASMSDETYAQVQALFPEADYLVPMFVDETPLRMPDSSDAEAEEDRRLLQGLPRLPIDPPRTSDGDD